MGRNHEKLGATSLSWFETWKLYVLSFFFCFCFSSWTFAAIFLQHHLTCLKILSSIAIAWDIRSCWDSGHCQLFLLLFLQSEIKVFQGKSIVWVAGQQRRRMVCLHSLSGCPLCEVCIWEWVYFPREGRGNLKGWRRKKRQGRLKNCIWSQPNQPMNSHRC